MIHVFLTISRLYAADGMAVKELLKIASLLFRAQQTSDKNGIRKEEEVEIVSVKVSVYHIWN